MLTQNKNEKLGRLLEYQGYKLTKKSQFSFHDFMYPSDTAAEVLSV